MSWARNKFTSILIIFSFLSNILLSDASACWWKGLPHQSPEISGAPVGFGGLDDGKPNQPDDIADNVFLHNGNFVYRHQDLFIPSRGINLEIIRTYKSQSRFNGRFGLGWELNYNKRLVALSDGSVFYLDGEGGRHQFGYIDGRNYISPHEVFDKLVQNENGTYTLTKKDGTKYNFNPNGTLSEIVERNGNKLTFSYAEGKLPIIGVPLYTKDPITKRVIAYQFQLTKITDSVGREINFTYDTNGRLTKITDFTQREILYTYDDFNHLTSVTDSAGNTTTYTYDSDRNLRSIVDPKGNTFLTNTYDQLEQVIAQTFGNDTFYFNYDTEKGITKFTDRKGYTWTYYFDKNGNPTQIIDPKGNITYKTYDTNNKMLLASVIYPKQNSTLYEYDERGNFTKITRKPKPDSPEPALITIFTYEPNFNFIKTITEPKGNTTVYDYDEKGNLIKITYPKVKEISPTVSFTYNQDGQLETITDPNGIITKYEYDPATGYLTRIINDFGDETHLNAATQFTYDSVGNVTSITDANGNKSFFEYNKLNQLTKTIAALPFNYQTKYTYDKNGNLTKIERLADQEATRWQTTEYEYDLLDQLTKIKQYLSDTEILTTQFQYDANGNRTKIIDAEGNITTYEYDERDLLFKVTDALGYTTEYTYDKNGNLSQIKDANANTTTYNYDDFDRLVKTTYPDSSYEQYTYDANSNLLTKRTRKGDIISYTYDNLNRLDLKTYPDTSTVDYVYDIASRLTNITDTNGTISYAYDALSRIIKTDQYGKTISYEYDELGNRTKLTYPDNAYITYEYDQLNRLTSIKNQAATTVTSYSYDVLSRRTQANYANNTQTTYQYDNVNRLLNLANKINGGADISSFGYTYDNVGNRLSMTTLGGTHNYTYDNIYQLTNVDYPEGYPFPDKTYNYDVVGNRISTVNDGTTNYTTNNLNQYTKIGTANYTYDLNGNLTSDGTWNYSYDYENRLTSASKTGTTATYKYDAFGRRIEKQVNGTTTKFLYDGDQVICAYDSFNSLIRKFVYGSGIDEPVKMTSGSVDYYYHFDGLGSVIELTDSSASIVEKYEYDAYGNTIIKDGSDNVLSESAIGNPYAFTARRLDNESGLYYFRARYYSPKIGRFLQKDPLTWGPDDPRVSNLTPFNKYNPLYITGKSVPSLRRMLTLSELLPIFILITKQTNPFQNFSSFYSLNIPSAKKKTLSYIFSQYIIGTGQTYPQLLHTYLYCYNNPINFIDPTGMIIGPGGVIGGAIVGAIVGSIMGGIQGYGEGSLGGAVVGALGGGIAGFIGGGIGGFIGGIFGGGRLGGIAGGLFGTAIGELLGPPPPAYGEPSTEPPTGKKK